MKRIGFLICRLWVLVIFSSAGMAAAWASEPTMLTRDDVSVLKKKLVAVSAALGQPPAGYAKENDQFQLPTEAYKKEGSEKYDWVMPSMTSRVSGGGEKKAKKSQEQIGQEYEKAVAEAMAKGNYQEMAKLSEELQKKMGEAHLAEVTGRKAPIDIQIMLNAYQNHTLDSDMVVFEKPGVIAVIIDSGDEDKNRILVLFDPVGLKETKTLSRADLKQPEGGVSKKTTVLNAVIELVGPAEEIKAWAQQINTGAVLGQIDADR